MDDTDDSDNRDLLAHVLLPVAHEDDALATATALGVYDPDRVTALHVVEKGGGVPDKTPVEQSEEAAKAAFEAFREEFPAVETAVRYRRDIVEGILDAAADLDASAIAFRPRGGSRLVQLLTGDRTLGMVTESDRPVVALPDPDDE
jgi:nucleotide-binding universal stress UspA family protein